MGLRLFKSWKTYSSWITRRTRLTDLHQRTNGVSSDSLLQFDRLIGKLDEIIVRVCVVSG